MLGHAGDVVYFEIFRTPAIVLNSFEAARDLLDKRSAIYSDRPRLVLLMEMCVPLSHCTRFVRQNALTRPQAPRTHPGWNPVWGPVSQASKVDVRCRR